MTPETAERFTREGYWRNRTITDFLDAAAAKDPDKLAVVDPRGRCTYGELKALVDRCALGLLELGIGPGDMVSFQLPNWTEWIVVHYAASRIGAVSNPLIPIYRDREVGYMLRLAASKLVVVPREFRGYDHAEMVQRLRPGLPDLEHVMVVGEPLDQMSSWAEFIETPWERRRDPAELPALRPHPDELTLLMFTSGTTGDPKGVMHTHNTLIAANDPWPDRLGLDGDTVFHMASTFGHLTGFLYGARLPTQLAATGVYQDVWNAERFVELVEEHGITISSGATPFLSDTLGAANLADHDVSSLRRYCCMGAPIPRVMLREAREKLPGVAVLGGWGQSENGLVTLGKPDDPEAKITNTDGCPWPGMQIRVVDWEGAELPAGTEGRLQVKGQTLFVGYANGIEMTRASFDGDWFDTGDLAVIDADGYLSISGRTKDVIIRGGENIPVSYVENVLYEHPRIDTVALVAMPDPRLQERACAVVVLTPGELLTLDDVRRFLQEKGVAKPYWPERLEVVADMPRTASGKIQKFRLREQILGGS
nr:AMP-binding protein [Pseudonocardia acidicola]